MPAGDPDVFDEQAQQLLFLGVVEGVDDEFAALLDGLSIQVALEDPEVDSDVAYDIAIHFAERELNLPPAKKRAERQGEGR